MKNVVIFFHGPEFTANQYAQAWEGLRAAGHSHPKGLLSHVAYANSDGGIDIVDVWESTEAFSEFGNTLGPIMQKIGVNLPQPQIIPAHYVYLGQTEMA
jgi:hypothetical protein